MVGLHNREDPSWQSFVRAPRDARIAPAAIVDGSVVGNVQNAAGLVSGSASLILSRQQGDPDAPCVTLDFGQNTVGLLSIDFGGSKQAQGFNGTQRPGLTLAFSETLQFLTSKSDYTRSQNMFNNPLVLDGVDHIAVGAEPYSWIDTLGCQYSGSDGNHVCSDGLHGFRYLKVCLAAYAGDANYTSNYGEVTIKSVHLNYEGFHGTPDTFKGWFECSDKDMTQWWYDAVYTNDMTIDIFLANNTEPRNAASQSLIGKLVLHDGAKRDRDPYVGDISVSGLTAFLSHDVTKGVENVLGDLADHQRSDGWIPPASINDYTLPLFDYPLHWVKSVHDLVFYTGAADFLNKYYPALAKVLDTFYPSMTNSTTQLLNRPGSYGDYAFIGRTGQVTYYNAFYVLALRLGADLADSLSKPADASRWRQRANTVATALLSRNWDASVGAFYDGGSCGTSLCNTHSQDGNSFSILASVTNVTLSESALGYISSNMALPYGNAFYDNGLIDGSFNTRVYAFLSYFEISARFQASARTVASGFDEIRRLYGWMATHDPGVTQWEGIGTNGEPYEGDFTSMAHGWSTGIVSLLSNYVLGVKPTGPGFSSWIIRPLTNDGGLTWARGVVPTPHGDITVYWEKGERLNLTVEAPEGTRGVVAIPVASSSVQVLVDGSTPASTQFQDGFMLVQHEGTKHVYTA
ncbi:glycoside hydrolase family 78 protein [Thozetella sp. PMI_491]|nr:glycoside hydrolase family 78 protein [Thozetella sp. PMI_491]